MKAVFRMAIVGVFAWSFGHVALAQDSVIPVMSLNERLKVLRADVEKGGYLPCGPDDARRRENYNSCAAFRAIYDRKECYGKSTAEMANAMAYGNVCDEIDLLQQARAPTVEYFNVKSPNWWKSLPASIAPGAPWMGGDELDRTVAKESLKGRLLAEFELSEIHSNQSQVVLILDRWNDEEPGEYNCGEYRDLFALRAGVLADFDGDGVAELRIHGNQHYTSDHCPPGSMLALIPGFGITLKKTSPDGPITVADQYHR